MWRTDSGEPLAAYNQFRFASIDETRHLLTRLFKPHVMRTTDQTIRVDARVNYLTMHRGLSLAYVAYGAPVEVTVEPFGDLFLIVAPLRDRFDLTYGSDRVCAHPALGTCISSQQPMRARLNAGCEQLMIGVNKVELERHLAQHLNTDVRDLEFELPIDFGTARGRHLIDVIACLYRAADGNDPPLPSSVYSGQLRDIFFNALLYAQPHNYRERLLRPVRHESPRIVKRVRDYVEEHAAEPIAVEALAGIAGTSARTLFALFQTHCGMSPMAYVRSVRLARIREELLQAKADDGLVTRVATKWGFYHLGHFSAAYKRAFGERPSDTVRYRR